MNYIYLGLTPPPTTYGTNAELSWLGGRPPGWKTHNFHSQFLTRYTHTVFEAPNRSQMSSKYMLLSYGALFKKDQFKLFNR